ncbi:MAG: DUF4118 domain-containing protein [Ottowia sp.]|nr:DUF4118 domain-containing protein [Ottowia sp.]
MYPHDDQRPDPDALLAQMQAQAKRASRGKLRIYFGASAGVGKTCAMLNAGRKLQTEGCDVVVGIVETHGRGETASLVEGLHVVPLKAVTYRDRVIYEFDIDAALLRRPQLILIDELAHSNAPQSRHPKRWQDVEELLEAGIDVFTTVNVQHLESLNDAVGGITGIRVSETLPDTVFNQADEVVLVDLPAEELLARLKAGKIYPPQQAERAAHHFFRKGNLIALRELALRRTAERIEDDVQAYRVEKSINTVWQTDAALLVCVGPSLHGDHVVRSAARLAHQLNATWQAIYIETPQLQRLPSMQRERILKTLKLAQDLGATTAVLSANDVALAAIDYARSHNFSKIILGRSKRRWPWRRSHHKRIATNAPDIDLIEMGYAIDPSLGHEPINATTSLDSLRGPIARRAPRYRRYIVAVLISLTLTFSLIPFLPVIHLTNTAMLFLLMVVLIAVRLGRGPAMAATCVGVAAFSFVFMSAHFSFAIAGTPYLATFMVMLIVGLVASHLTASLRYQARVARHRENQTRSLYEFARELSGVLKTEQIFEITRTFIARTFSVRATLLLPDDAGSLQFIPGKTDTAAKGADDLLDIGIAQWAFDHASSAGMGTDTLPGSPLFYLPLVAPMRTRGVLAIIPENRRWILIPEQRQQLDTFAALAAIALERVHYIEVAQDALVRMESERLRHTLLATLSQDLQPSLLTLTHLSTSLRSSSLALSEADKTLVRALHEEIARLHHHVASLLAAHKNQDAVASKSVTQ